MASPVEIEALVVVLPTPPLPEVITIVLANVLSRIAIVLSLDDQDERLIAERLKNGMKAVSKTFASFNLVFALYKFV